MLCLLFYFLLFVGKILFTPKCTLKFASLVFSSLTTKTHTHTSLNMAAHWPTPNVPSSKRRHKKFHFKTRLTTDVPLFSTNKRLCGRQRQAVTSSLKNQHECKSTKDELKAICIIFEAGGGGHVLNCQSTHFLYLWEQKIGGTHVAFVYTVPHTYIIYMNEDVRSHN